MAELKYKTITAQECPSCGGADLGLVDDKDKDDLKYECPACKTRYYGHVEGKAGSKKGVAYKVDGYLGYTRNPKKSQKIDGETWYQWARRLFECENCAECGKGVRGHEPRIVMGKWFAMCKNAR